ncbi:F0F1 ATP synthase subunit delta [Candidatus Erwinia haradaeae]|uniref:ATP synthase subunit delta n=1 Tax=Candidatus Erwinia haradaeae TaxID=1922217 RepID=A0A451D791_9GAMM|nr:F0F1 ATP synthase subunit delta [Candidatus Erwinia haradaeae]VFP81702.1 ATP synthase subunit delta [Candidatus Erwinia haradaeae]
MKNKTLDSMTLARPYAKAAFDFSIRQNCLDQWQKTLTFTALVVSYPSIQTLISKPLAPYVISDIFIKICGDHLDHHVQNFIRILSENKRLSLLSNILEKFIQLRTRYEAIIDLEVLSAKKLNVMQMNNIRTTMEKHLSSKVKINYIIDTSLIAGLVIRMGDIVIDGSIRNRIEQLTKVLKS